MTEMTSSQRRALRARAHNLHPVASISQKGLSEAVLAEIDRGLKAHELIKVRIYGAERDEREALLAEICLRLDASPVQHIGNIVIIFRQNSDESGQEAGPGATTTKPPSSRAAPVGAPVRRRRNTSSARPNGVASRRRKG
jgi:putative YhbY family RNA-binding protein